MQESNSVSDYPSWIVERQKRRRRRRKKCRWSGPVADGARARNRLGMSVVAAVLEHSHFRFCHRHVQIIYRHALPGKVFGSFHDVATP